MLKPALVGGVLIGILSAVPVISMANCICCAWVIGGGILAANLYVKASPVAVTLGRGALLGMLAGAIGAVVDTVFSIPLHMLMSGIGVNVLGQVEEILNQVQEIPAEQREALRAIFSSGPGTGVLLVLIGGMVSLVVFSVMGMAGGAIGVALFEKRKPGPPVEWQPPEAAPPPLPPTA